MPNYAYKFANSIQLICHPRNQRGGKINLLEFAATKQRKTRKTIKIILPDQRGTYNSLSIHCNKHVYIYIRSNVTVV